MSQAHLEKTFSQFGDIVTAKILLDRYIVTAKTLLDRYTPVSSDCLSAL